MIQCYWQRIISANVHEIARKIIGRNNLIITCVFANLLCRLEEFLIDINTRDLFGQKIRDATSLTIRLYKITYFIIPKAHIQSL